MNPRKEALLLQLADYTETIHLALEGEEVPIDHRMIYLGHLAMCARIFKSVYLDEPVESVMQYAKIEHSAYRLGTPNTERGALTKEAWNIFEPILLAHLQAEKDA